MGRVFRFRLFWCALIGVCVLGCSIGPPLLPEQAAQQDLPARAELESVPFFPYEKNHCGPAALASLLGATGVRITPEDLAPKVYMPGKRGSIQPEIVAAIRRHGLIPYRIEPGLSDLVGQLHSGRPVLVLTNLGLALFPVWHYAVVIGYDLDGDWVLLRSGDTPRESVPARVFQRTWERADKWGLVALKPGEAPVHLDPAAYLRAVAEMEALGLLEQARKAYESALVQWPGNPVALFGLGNTAYALGELKAAEKALRRLYLKDPERPAVANNLAVVLSGLGRHEEAMAMIRGAFSSNDMPASLRQRLSRTRKDIMERRAIDLDENSR
jgi:hypothetical protein